MATDMMTDSFRDELLAFLDHLSKSDTELWGDKKPEEIMLLSTVIKNTAYFIGQLLNTHSNVKITPTFNSQIYLDATKEIYRIFLSGLHIYFEQAIVNWAKRNSIEVVPSRAVKLRKVLESVGSKLTDKEIKSIKGLVDIRPNAQDIVESVVTLLPTKQETESTRAFLSAFSVVRNKVSHSDNKLSESDTKRLKEGGFEAWAGGEYLTCSVVLFPPVLTRLIKILKDVEATKQKHEVS